jgi:hypothetical protein
LNAILPVRSTIALPGHCSAGLKNPQFDAFTKDYRVLYGEDFKESFKMLIE